MEMKGEGRGEGGGEDRVCVCFPWYVQGGFKVINIPKVFSFRIPPPSPPSQFPRLGSVFVLFCAPNFYQVGFGNGGLTLKVPLSP